MGTGVKTDRLGDGDETSDDAGLAETQKTHENETILREALKGNMLVENGEDRQGRGGGEVDLDVRKLVEADVDQMKQAERKGFGEVY